MKHESTGPVPPDIEIPTTNAHPQAEPATAKKPVAGNAIAIRDGGSALAPADHVQLLALIDRMIEAKAVPKHLENRLQVLSAWNFAAQLGLPPQPSLRNVAVIEGVPSLFGDLPLSLVQAHKDFMFYREYLVDPDYTEISVDNKNLTAPLFAGVVEIQRKGMPKPVKYAFTLDDAERAGLNKKSTRNGNPTVWAKYPQVMFIRRARAMALKAHFADALCGAGIAEYDFHHAPDLSSTREVFDTDKPQTPEFGNKIDQLD